jgi:hypothetical protein
MIGFVFVVLILALCGVAVLVSWAVYTSVDDIRANRQDHPESVRFVRPSWFVIIVRYVLTPIALVVLAAEAYGHLVLDTPSSFENIFEAKRPASVIVLRTGQTGLYDHSMWIHFTVSPTDLSRITRLQNYEDLGQSILTREQYSSLSPPEWWMPGRKTRQCHVYERWSSDRIDWWEIVVDRSASNVYAFRSRSFD